VLRNIGEVLGVFGHMRFTPRRGRPPVYRGTSVDVENLTKLEDLITKLQSPLLARRVSADRQVESSGGTDAVRRPLPWMPWPHPARRSEPTHHGDDDRGGSRRD
jgi:hypothetical protein